ncbi:hypothetical protein ACLEPN_04280 [Myxococcus sp. 1LA]
MRHLLRRWEVHSGAPPSRKTQMPHQYGVLRSWPKLLRVFQPVMSRLL